MTYDELVDYCKEASQTISELDYKNRILEKENQELKKKYKNTVEKLSEQLELLTSKLDKYDLIVDERNQLKQQLKEKNIEYFRLSKENNEYAIKLHEYKTQQKEFIKFLEDNYKETQDIWYIKILQKYKEIIGDDK